MNQWERRHGIRISKSEPHKEQAWVYQSIAGHAFLAWRSSWRMLVHISYITAAGNSISSAAPVRAIGVVWKRQAVRLSITYKVAPDGSLSSSQPGGPPCWVSPLAFGLFGATLLGSCTWLNGKYISGLWRFPHRTLSTFHNSKLNVCCAALLEPLGEGNWWGGFSGLKMKPDIARSTVPNHSIYLSGFPK
jgi:hypothetical protein